MYSQNLGNSVVFPLTVSLPRPESSLGLPSRALTSASVMPTRSCVQPSKFTCRVFPPGLLNMLSAAVPLEMPGTLGLLPLAASAKKSKKATALWPACTSVVDHKAMENEWGRHDSPSKEQGQT